MALPALATSADLSIRLGRALTATETAQADALLADASAVIRSYLGQDITQATTTVALAASDGIRLDLPQRPVTAVASVTIDGVAVTGYTRVGSTLYRYGGWGYAHYLTDPVDYLGWPTPPPPVVAVTYTHGWATADIPGEIKSAVIQMAMRAVTNPGGLRSEQVGAELVTYAAETLGGVALNAAEKAALGRWRRKAGTLTVGGS